MIPFLVLAGPFTGPDPASQPPYSYNTATASSKLAQTPHAPTPSHPPRHAPKPASGAAAAHLGAVEAGVLESLYVDLQPNKVGDAGRAHTGRRLSRWTICEGEA
jgi:hypothetical protein